MTPGEVMDEIVADASITHSWQVQFPATNECHEVLMIWCGIQNRLRPEGPHHMSFSPKEVALLKTAMRVIAAAIERAHVKSPAPFRLVEEGGR